MKKQSYGSDPLDKMQALYGPKSQDMEAYRYPALIIDDEEGIHNSLRGLLKIWGFEPISAFNAYDGLALAISIHPLFIILDFTMKEVNGYILLKMLKRIEITSDIPVLILSGTLDRKIIIDIHNVGADKFITKPFQEKILLRRIMECLNMSVIKELNLHYILEDN